MQKGLGNKFPFTKVTCATLRKLQPVNVVTNYIVESKLEDKRKRRGERESIDTYISGLYNLFFFSENDNTSVK